MGAHCDTIPAELRDRAQWVVWREETREGKPTKVPYRAANPSRKASSTDPATWATFDQAVAAADRADGIGYVFAADDPFVGIDLDKLTPPGTSVDLDKIAPAVRAAVTLLDSYTEKSVSETGLHVIVSGNLNGSGNRKGTFEVYAQGRYFCMTGAHVAGTPTTIEHRQTELEQVLAEFLPPKPAKEVRQICPTSPVSLTDRELLEKMFAAKNGAKIRRLWDGDWSGHPSQSEADAALCCHLAFWTGCDAARMDALFRQSGLMREKWERLGQRTIDGAIGQTTEVYSEPVPALGKGAGTAYQYAVDPPADFHCTDLGNGERLTAAYADRLRYEPASGRWYAWLSTHWEPDATLTVDAFAAEVVRRIYGEAGRATDEHRRKELGKHAAASESRSRQQAMIDSSRHMMAVTPDHWDTDPMLFNCANGTIDLSTGRLLPHRPGDRITKVSPVTFDPSATCPTFDRFLCQVVPEEVMREFLQRSFGYGLTGLTVEQFFWFLFGLGANGKSTLTNIVQFILADYSRTAAPKLLERSRERHPTELADLFGARVVVAHETQEGRALDETRVKQLTGGDPVTARFMRGDFFTFNPTHKIWMHGNHKPRIAGTDYAIWRRPLLVDFPVTIAPKDKDPRLLEKLKGEASGILNWLVVGCLTWLRTGIDPPPSVIAATESYRLQEDRIGAFIGEKCVQERGARERGGDLYKAYAAWCADEDEDPVTLSAFGRSLNERGFFVEANHRHKQRRGIRLADDEHHLFVEKP